jgi:hypothetical protein
MAPCYRANRPEIRTFNSNQGAVRYFSVGQPYLLTLEAAAIAISSEKSTPDFLPKL